MTSTVFLHLALSVVLAPADAPRYAIEITPVKRIETTYTLAYEAPKLQPKEWEFFVAKPPELPYQTDVRISCEPAGETISAAGATKRPLQRIRLVVTDPEAGQRGQLKVKCEASLMARKLVERNKNAKSTAVTLAAEERRFYVSPTATIDFAGVDFQRWLGEQKLRRQKGESDVDFARRVFLALKRDFKYEYVATMDRHATAVCQAGKSDCGGLANLFVGCLRSEAVPARTLVGRWTKSATRGEKVGDVDYFQQHVKAEFFAEDAGWVPVDVSSAVLHDLVPDGLRFFGHDRGDFLVLHVDSDLEVDTHYFGRQTIPWLQGAAYWVTGSGKLDEATSREDWQVRVLTQ